MNESHIPIIHKFELSTDDITFLNQYKYIRRCITGSCNYKHPLQWWTQIKILNVFTENFFIVNSKGRENILSRERGEDNNSKKDEIYIFETIILLLILMKTFYIILLLGFSYSTLRIYINLVIFLIT